MIFMTEENNPCEDFDCPDGYTPKETCECVADLGDGCRPDALADDQEFWESDDGGYIDPEIQTFSSSAKYRGSKAWLSQITGKHPKWKFNRDFIKTTTIDMVRKVPESRLDEGMVLERGSNYYTGSGNKQADREYFEVLCVDQEGTLVKYLTEEDILAKFRD